jgi:transposase
MKLQALGIDLAKNVFHLVGLDSSGQVVIRKRCSRRQVLAFTANLQVEVIGMGACSGAHFPTLSKPDIGKGRNRRPSSL